VLADHYTNGIMQDGTLNFYQAYNGLTSDISIKTNAAKISYSSAETIKNQAQMHYDQISAVSVQEEFVNMMSYQQCYQASAQIIQTAKTLFDTIIGIARSN
jgi:flagellar hook-associated protein 1